MHGKSGFFRTAAGAFRTRPAHYGFFRHAERISPDKRDFRSRGRTGALETRASTIAGLTMAISDPISHAARGLCPDFREFGGNGEIGLFNSKISAQSNVYSEAVNILMKNTLNKFNKCQAQELNPSNSNQIYIYQIFSLLGF